MSDPTSDIELDALRAKAEAATQGEWRAEPGNDGARGILAPPDDKGGSMVIADVYAWPEVVEANAAFIVAARPSVVLALIAEITRLRAESAALPAAFEAEPLVRREIRTNLERARCPSCGAANVFLAHSVRNLDARRHVECRICQMRGPIKCSDEEAVAAWNALPSAALPEGWKAVPVELPDNMMIATLRAGYLANGATEGEASALVERWKRDPERRALSRAQYAAMLAAAPTPPLQEGQDK